MAPIFRHRGKLLPLIYLSRLLKREAIEHDDGMIHIIVLQVEGRQFGLVVDRICDTQEIVVKPLGQQLKHLACYGGATIMGDGQPALILDVAGVAKLAGLEAKANPVLLSTVQARSPEETSELLLFRAGSHLRLGLPLSIINRLEEIPVEALEFAAGQRVVAYRGELLPLVHVASALGTGEECALPTSGRLKVVVVNGGALHGDSRVGLVVDEILDIVEGVIQIMRTSSNPAILGSAVIGGGVTDLLDVTALQDKTRSQWSRTATTNLCPQRVLSYDPRPVSREMTHALLISAGHRNRHVTSAAEMHTALAESGVDLLMVADDGTGIPEWWDALRRQDARCSKIPQVVLMNTDEAAKSADKEADDIDIVIDRHDRAGVLCAIQRLVEPYGKRAA